MLALHIPKSDLTPLVIFDPKSSTLMLEGKLIPENVDVIFIPVYEWIEDYLKDDKALVLLFRLYYYNSSSFKRLYNLCKKLNEYFKQGKKISVRWEYMEDDESSKADAEELLEHTDFPFEIISVEE